LLQGEGVYPTIRDTRGQDIDAAAAGDVHWIAFKEGSLAIPDKAGSLTFTERIRG
jgi:hypothetical protein